MTAAAVATGSTAQTPVITAAVDGGRGERRDLEGGRRVVRGDEGIRPARPGRVPGHDGCDRGAVPGDEPDRTRCRPGSTPAASGPVRTGTISGITVVMSAGLATGKAFLINTAATEVYEQRLGSLQVTEPSVLGCPGRRTPATSPPIVVDRHRQHQVDRLMSTDWYAPNQQAVGTEPAAATADADEEGGRAGQVVEVKSKEGGGRRRVSRPSTPTSTPSARRSGPSPTRRTPCCGGRWTWRRRG